MKTYQYLARLIMYQPGLFALNALLWTLVFVGPLLPGWITREFFNHLTGNATLDWSPWVFIALLVAVGLARVLTLWGGWLIDIYWRFLIGNSMRINMLTHVLRLPGARALNETPGEALVRLRDDPQHAEDTLSLSLDALGQTVFLIVAVVMLAQINARMTLLVFLPVVVVVFISNLLARKVRRYREEASAATGRVTGAIGEIFTAAQAVQVAGAEERVIRHLKRLSVNRRSLMLKDQLITVLMQAIAGATTSLGTGLILLLSANLLQSGTFTVGDFSIFVYYLAMVAQNTDFLGHWLTLYQQAGVAFQRMTTLMQGAPAGAVVAHIPLDIRNPLPPSPEVQRTAEERLDHLSVAGLTCLHPETGRGVRDVSLTLRRGTFTVITGPVGSGKTTLLQALLGLLPTQGGEVRWNGRPITAPADFFTPPRAAFTPQVPVLFSANLRENILLGRPETALEQAIHGAVLERDLDQLEHGLDTPVGHRGVKLSGGQMQRTAAARMFAAEPELLVFDDLSSALDVETERLLWERVFAQDGATSLAVSHRRTAIRRADRIIVLNEGRVEAEGTLEEVLARSPYMQELWYGKAGGQG